MALNFAPVFFHLLVSALLGLPAFVLKPSAETEHREQVPGYGPDGRDAFIGTVFDALRDGMDGDDAGGFEVVHGPFCPAFAETGNLGQKFHGEALERSVGLRNADTEGDQLGIVEDATEQGDARFTALAALLTVGFVDRIEAGEDFLRGNVVLADPLAELPQYAGPVRVLFGRRKPTRARRVMTAAVPFARHGAIMRFVISSL